MRDKIFQNKIRKSYEFETWVSHKNYLIEKFLGSRLLAVKGGLLVKRYFWFLKNFDGSYGLVNLYPEVCYKTCNK